MKTEDILSWRGEQHERFLIIQNHDLHAGFGALLVYALNGIRKAKSINAIPVIDFNAQNSPYFYDATKGEDVWEYFFNKISPFTLDQILVWKADGKISNSEIHYLSSEEAAKTHQYNPERLATFWAWQEPADKATWMKDKRVLGREYVQKYIQPNQDITTKVQAFRGDNFTANLVIGIHIRGTDFAYAKPTPIEDYLREIDDLLEQNGTDSYQLFIATDQKQYIEIFKQHYGTKAIFREAIRSDNHIAPFRFNHVSGFQKGEDVLIDILLLSKCHHILKGAAATGELALWFNNHQNVKDFALYSGFNQKQYDELESTYSKMNIAGKSRVALKIHRSREQLVRKFIESRLGKMIYYKSALARKILKH